MRSEMALRFSGRLKVMVASWPENSSVSVSNIQSTFIARSRGSIRRLVQDSRLGGRGAACCAPTWQDRLLQVILIHKRGVCILCANFVGHGEQGSELGRIEAWISAGFL